MEQLRQSPGSARKLHAIASAPLEVAGSYVSPSTIPAFHLWLPISEPWRSDEFVHHAATLGVSLAPTDLFVPRDPAPHAIRVCTGNEADPARVEDGLRVLARMLKSGPPAIPLPRFALSLRDVYSPVGAFLLYMQRTVIYMNGGQTPPYEYYFIPVIVSLLVT